MSKEIQLPEKEQNLSWLGMIKGPAIAMLRKFLKKHNAKSIILSFDHDLVLKDGEDELKPFSVKIYAEDIGKSFTKLSGDDAVMRETIKECNRRIKFLESTFITLHGMPEEKRQILLTNIKSKLENGKQQQ